jgi:threonine dehydrogenase-like Zn-dependent dehydrogenase
MTTGRRTSFPQRCPAPQPEEGESLIHIRVAAVCSTDKEIIKGYKPDFHGVLGHEFVGTVETSGDASLIGKRVVGEINAGCGDCIYCKTGREKHCLSRRCIGIADKDGCFADYMTIRTSCLHVVPDDMPDEVAVNTEPLAAPFASRSSRTSGLPSRPRSSATAGSPFSARRCSP